MKICEGCIKQDVCKFKKEVEKYEAKRTDIPEPLVPDLSCKYKSTGQPNWMYTAPWIDRTTYIPDTTPYNPYIYTPPPYTTGTYFGTYLSSDLIGE